jgi:hypothetical protein
VSLVLPGISSEKITRAEVAPYGVTGDELNIRGEQNLKFNIDGQVYRHTFCVCALSTDAGAIVGTDFLSKVNAKIDLQEQKFWLL